MSALRVAVLGSTGSIGRQALDIAGRYPDRIEIVALSAHASVSALAEQAERFGSPALALGDPEAAAALARRLGRPVGEGPAGIEELAASSGADLVLNALVGAAGLRASIATLRSGARLALANKESLVAGGELVTSLGLDRIIPVDSEHSAIFQCLLGERPHDVAGLWLTASGGPFRGKSRADLTTVTVEDALAHPRWTMGPKITIDSATLMNKGLETIEAHHLFGIGYDRIRIVIHPQSCIHSMVEFADGSVKAHLGATDMRVPIQYAFSFPARWPPPVSPVDFAALGRLDFEEPDYDTFRCLTLALEAGRVGGTAPAALNAANEVAVAAFLAERIGFDEIADVVESVLDAHVPIPLDSFETVQAADVWARAEAERHLGS